VSAEAAAQAVAADAASGAEPVDARAAAEDVRSRPYAPSWLDRLFDRIEDVPGPSWVVYAALVVPSVILTLSEGWLSGYLSFGSVEPQGAFWGFATVAILAAAHYMRRFAGTSFDAFLPALGASAGDAWIARYRLTVMPPAPVIVLTVFSIVITPLYYAVDPVASGVQNDSPAGLAARTISETLVSIFVLAILYRAIRQMRLVDRIHATARYIDPFRPAPIFAFSRLTALTGAILIVFNAAGLAVNPTALTRESFFTIFLPWLVVIFVGSILVFLVPLLGMRRRLAEIRARLESDAGGRMSALLAELNEAIDARDTARVAALDGAVSALRHEQELLAKLPTWPWSLGTIRGFGSALLVPIALFLVQRYLNQLLG
jgi:hypothetical protein